MDPFTPVMSRIQELGIDVVAGRTRAIDAHVGELEASLRRGGSRQDYHIAHGDAVVLSDVSRIALSSDAPLMVWSTVIQPRTAQAYRRMGVQYADAAGNAWIEFGDVIVDIRGRRSTGDRHLRAVDRRSTNLFSAGRSKVIFALITWPRLWSASKREVAHVAGVSVGLAHDTLALLDQAGYGRHSRMSRDYGLLDPWAAAFATGLVPQLSLASYRGDIDAVATGSPTGMAAISGESAVSDLIHPTTLTLYVDDLDPRTAVANRWRTDGDPNIFVRRRFWRSPEEPERGPGAMYAPWTIVYADLISSDDPRLQNVAQLWRDRHADPA